MARFVIDVDGDNTTLTLNGEKVGAVWGPAVDDPSVWVAYRLPETSSQRIHTREAAEAYLREAIEILRPRQAAA